MKKEPEFRGSRCWDDNTGTREEWREWARYLEDENNRLSVQQFKRILQFSLASVLLGMALAALGFYFMLHNTLRSYFY